MRVCAWPLIGLVVLGVASGEEAADEASKPEATDDDLDLDNLDTDGDTDGPEDNTPDESLGKEKYEEIDFDKDMPEDKRKERMQACLTASKEMIAVNRNFADSSVKSVMNQAGGQLSKEQAWNYVIFNMMLMCYQQITDDMVETAQKGGEIGVGDLEEVFAAPKGTPKRAGQRHVELWESVARESHDKESKAYKSSQQSSYSSESTAGGKPGDIGFMGQNLTGGSGLMYILGVFAVIFGLVTLVIIKMSKPTSKNVKYQSSKSIAKKEKAEKMAAKKSR